MDSLRDTIRRLVVQHHNLVAAGVLSMGMGTGMYVVNAESASTIRKPETATVAAPASKEEIPAAPKASRPEPTAKIAPGDAAPMPEPAKATPALFSSTLTWEQNFMKLPAGQPDPAVWRYELDPAVPGYNDEAQAYTSRTENVRVEAGKGLAIEARKEPYSYAGDPSGKQYAYTSARIDTRDSFSFEYGKIEAVMKLPKGAGTWPAFWLLSANQPHTGKLNPTDADWQQDRFYLKDGELDIMEHYGNLPGLIEATAHSYESMHEGQTKLADYADAFHTYGVELTPDEIVWTLDGRPYYRLAKISDNPDEWPFGNGNKLYPILNLAMGGSGGGQIDDATGPWLLQVRQVRFYEYIGQ